MNVGTRSLLFGAHQVLMHPVYVVLAWHELYGEWPTWREAVCILVHDWGYWGCPEMDGPQGTRHPQHGAQIAQRLFGDDYFELCALHSRKYARRFYGGMPTSKLCSPDKLATAMVPRWLYLLLTKATGELIEYRADAAEYHHRTGKGVPPSATDAEWHQWLVGYTWGAAKRELRP